MSSRDRPRSCGSVLYEPNEPLLRKIQEEFGLHDLAIEDALSAHQRPKVERYDNSLFVVLRTAQINEPKPGKPCDVRYGEVHIFLGRNFIVTVRHGYATSFTPVRTRAESTPDLLNQGPAFVLYAVMDFIVDQYFPDRRCVGRRARSARASGLHAAVQPAHDDTDLQAQARPDRPQAGCVASHRTLRASSFVSTMRSWCQCRRGPTFAMSTTTRFASTT